MGKEQEIAIKMAVQDFHGFNCAKLVLHIRDSWGDPGRATSAAMDLMDSSKVQAFIGTLTLPAAALISKIDKNFTEIPTILLASTAISPSQAQLETPNFIQMANDISIHLQCIAAIVGYFQWQKVTVIYEENSVFSTNSDTFALLSDSLQAVGSTIEEHLAFPFIYPSIRPEVTIEKELSKVKNKTNRVFIVVQSSLELASHLFWKAKQMGMMEKGYVWIIPDEVASFLDSLDPSVVSSMQGVLGYKTVFNDTSKRFREFKLMFRRNYELNHFREENSDPSLFALRAYDAALAIAKTPDTHQKKSHISTNFDGLSGHVSFRNGELAQTPIFEIINVVGRSYKNVAFWSPAVGFSKEILGENIGKETQFNVSNGKIELGPIYWPGGQLTAPTGMAFSSSSGKEGPLRLGAIATGAFHQFVNVSQDRDGNRTEITGFSVDVFEAAVRYLPYDLPYVLVPFYGSYEEMLQKVYLKGLDGAIGDINVLQERYQWVEFTQPYVRSGIAMVVPTKLENTKEPWMFMEVFDKKVWLLIPSMSIFIGFVVWLIEHRDNPEFRSESFSEQAGTIFWFSVTVLFFVQKESLKRNLSKVVLAPWLFLILMLTSNFTAALTSKLTVAQILPSVKDVETLRKENAVVGCNRRSFICKYLTDVLKFRPNNVREIASIDDYPEAFRRGYIKGAFFVTAHANVFLAKYCKGYTIAGPTFMFGGLSFAFPKGSPLSLHVSLGIIKTIEKGEIEQMEKDMLSRCKCSDSDDSNDSSSLGFKPFSGLFYISGGIALVALLVTLFHSMKDRFGILSFIDQLKTTLDAWPSLNLFRLYFRKKTQNSEEHQHEND